MTVSTAPIAVLVGLRGSGKSTVGATLAAELGVPFHDLDDLALESCREPDIASVFRERGEAAWREAETRALETGLAFPGSILALGGGAPIVPAIRTRLNEADGAARADGAAIVFWLDAPDAVLADRIRTHDGSRPPLVTDDDRRPLDPLEECRRLRDARSEAYRSVSDHAIDSDAPTTTIVHEILAREALVSGEQT